jgi:hypothetical protein
MSTSRPASPKPGQGGSPWASANLFSGGALLQLSIFALGIMPYITASIIIQLLVVVIPRFETSEAGGPDRHREADPVHAVPDHRPWRFCSLRHWSPPLVTLQSLFGSGLQEHHAGPEPGHDPDHGPDDDSRHRASIMWMGELITDRGNRQRACRC